MASLEIAKLGNPVLRKKAEPVSQDEIDTQAFQQFIDDMFETMVEAEGIGLAAPQVSRTQQVVVMDLPGEGGFPKTVLINPKIVFYGPQQVENWEGCL
ncbi:MAG TPA: peptide deformylase, partial [Nitrospiraceae bacterium]|nr:peptide deformylase [Nitrospiraceae bacterium]